MKGNTRIMKLSRWTILTIFILAAMLSGCGGATPTIVEPTVDQQPTYDAVSTQAVETFIVDMTRNAPTATQVPTETLVIPTETPFPTNTPAPVVEVPTSTPTRPFIPWTATPTATQAAYACSVLETSPASGANIKKGTAFDTSWKLQNTGTQPWTTGNTDIRYVSGAKMQESGDVFDMTQGVNPNGTITIIIDMIAPSTTGTSTATWALSEGGNTICTMTVTINVVE